MVNERSILVYSPRTLSKSFSKHWQICLLKLIKCLLKSYGLALPLKNGARHDVMRHEQPKQWGHRVTKPITNPVAIEGETRGHESHLSFFFIEFYMLIIFGCAIFFFFLHFLFCFVFFFLIELNFLSLNLGIISRPVLKLSISCVILLHPIRTLLKTRR